MACQSLYKDVSWRMRSAASERICYRKRGWSLKGLRATIRRLVKRSDRWSVLPAYSMDGILTYHIYQGGIDGERYVWFVRDIVLPLCNPHPGPNSVLVMDNCRIHHHHDVQRACDEAGVILIYLPPYSPDLNPIEELFSVLKAWIKKNMELAQSMDFEKFLHLAIDSNGSDKYSRGQFSHVNVNIPG